MSEQGSKHSTAARTDFRDIRPDTPQEWTKHGKFGIDVGHKLLPLCYNTVSRDLLFDSHNAALAVQRQAVVDAMSLSNEMCEKLEQQLAAERKKHRNPCDAIFDHKWLDPKCVNIGCQSLVLDAALAAEKETKEKAIEAWSNRNLKLAEQLAAAKVSINICVGAAGVGDESELCGWIDESLKKLKQADIELDRLDGERSHLRQQLLQAQAAIAKSSPNQE